MGISGATLEYQTDESLAIESLPIVITSDERCDTRNPEQVSQKARALATKLNSISSSNAYNRISRPALADSGCELY